MWKCAGCAESIDDEFDVCWNCGTSIDGEPDPTFVAADDAGPIDDPALDVAETELTDVDAELAAGLPELVECYASENVIEAKFVADQLRLAGIPAVADRHDNNVYLGGWQPKMWGYGPRVRVREQDLARASAWLEHYKQRRRAPSSHEPGITFVEPPD